VNIMGGVPPLISRGGDGRLCLFVKLMSFEIYSPRPVPNRLLPGRGLLSGAGDGTRAEKSADGIRLRRCELVISVVDAFRGVKDG
jgi:hypothetical protein